MSRLPERTHIPLAVAFATLLTLSGFLIGRPAGSVEGTDGSSAGRVPTTEAEAGVAPEAAASPTTTAVPEAPAPSDDDPPLPAPGTASTSSGSRGADVPHADVEVLADLRPRARALVAEDGAVYAVLPDGSRVRADDGG